MSASLAKDSQQAIDRTVTIKPPPVAESPDETTWVAESRIPIGAPSRRSDSQQPTVPLTPMGPPAAASISEAKDGSTPNEPPPHVPERQGQFSNSPRGHRCTALLLWDPVLQTLAAGLDDVESTRVAQANRYRILTTTAEDSDGDVRGFGLSEDHPAVAALQAQLGTLEFLDKQMSKALAKQLRAHPLYPWVKATKGLGDKTIARLLGAIRDPYWNDLHDRPRTVGELFAYCGVAGPGLRRARGQKSNWSPDARKRLWIIATTIVKVGGTYRAVYDAGREQYAEKLHTEPCAQCGKKGEPASTGTPWRDGHKHAGAVRLVMRAVLRDLWTGSRAIYEANGAAS